MRMRIAALACAPLLILLAVIAATGSLRARADAALDVQQRAAATARRLSDAAATAEAMSLAAALAAPDAPRGAGAGADGLRRRFADLERELERLARDPLLGPAASALRIDALAARG